jgi:predicted ArsR family transcriptional regulator
MPPTLEASPMEIPETRDDDVLALPVRARLFEALTALRRPASTQELADRVRRHPNTVRVQLRRLADADLIDCRTVRQARGRPRHEWAIAPGAKPGGRPPQAHGQLGGWLARAIARDGASLADIEDGGREIDRELAPEGHARPVRDALGDALTALGFAPRPEPRGPGRLRYVLGNCPYRDAVRENLPAICTLHRGITRGLLERLDPGARLADFVARDPYAAGCIVDVAT